MLIDTVVAAILLCMQLRVLPITFLVRYWFPCAADVHQRDGSFARTCNLITMEKHISPPPIQQPLCFSLKKEKNK